MLFYPFIISLIGFAFAIYLIKEILSKETGNKRMIEVSNAIKEGATAYLSRQYRTIFIFIAIFSVLFYLIFGFNQTISFLLGSIFSAAAGYIGMNVAIRANVRTSQAAKKGVYEALKVAFDGGNVMGLFVMCFGVFGISVLYFILRDPGIIIFFSFGASFVALFARLGGGIYTKGADVGADLVGKVEKGIPEDDPRNPAVIADNVGDNVGDVAGMGADLFESFCASIIAAMIIAISIGKSEWVIYPLVVSSIGIISMMAGRFFLGKERDPQKALNSSVFSSVIMGVIILFLVSYFVKDFGLNLFFASFVGVLAMIGITVSTQYYTSYSYPPTKEISKASTSGTSMNILSGFANGLISTAIPILIVVAATIISYKLFEPNGTFGVAIAAVGMLSLAGVAIAIDSCGAISDNAGGITEMSKLGKEVRNITDKLDAAGNTSAAIGKGAAIGSAALTVLALYSAFFEVTKIKIVSITNVYVLSGIFIGGIIPLLFSAFAIKSVNIAASAIVNEVRRQFKEKNLLKGNEKPDYARCVDICTKTAIREMVVPSLLAVFAPLAVGFILGPEALAGFLGGATLSGLLFAILLANSGASWDNAKKYIELGNFGGKGSEAHKAAVVGDTVGDSFKDCAGPSLNILIKIMATISLLFGSLFLTYSLI
jgi:K(+)-stimulated pyrophosphate-energized sodium pump